VAIVVIQSGTAGGVGKSVFSSILAILTTGVGISSCVIDMGGGVSEYVFGDNDDVDPPYLSDFLLHKRYDAIKVADVALGKTVVSFNIIPQFRPLYHKELAFMVKRIKPLKRLFQLLILDLPSVSFKDTEFRDLVQMSDLNIVVFSPEKVQKVLNSYIDSKHKIAVFNMYDKVFEDKKEVIKKEFGKILIIEYDPALASLEEYGIGYFSKVEEKKQRKIAHVVMEILKEVELVEQARV